MDATPRFPGSAFTVPAEAYDALMGRYLATLAPAFADAADVQSGQRALDVGCGPGGLTAELVRRLGADAVAAIDPSPPFVAACRHRLPGVDVRRGVAEELPFPDSSFDVTLASLVVAFMTDPAAGVREMARVTAPGGRVAACFWDLRRMPTLNTYWASVAASGGGDTDDLRRVGGAEGELAGLLRDAGLAGVAQTTLAASARYADFEDWWQGLSHGVGPIGVHFQSLTPDVRTTVRGACLDRLGRPAGEFTLTAYAWCATGVRPAADG